MYVRVRGEISLLYTYLIYYTFIYSMKYQRNVIVREKFSAILSAQE